MFGLGPTELLLILAIVMIVFGAGKLPQVLSSMGKGVKEFRDASEGRAEIAPRTEQPVVERVVERPTVSN